MQPMPIMNTSGDESSVAISALQLLSTGQRDVYDPPPPSTPERPPASIEVSTPNATNVTPTVRQSAFPSISIDSDEWNVRIQDVGGIEVACHQKRINQNKSPLRSEQIVLFRIVFYCYRLSNCF